MSLAEKTSSGRIIIGRNDSLTGGRAPSPIDLLDARPRPEEARRYSYGDLVRVFGKDYRGKAKDYFRQRGIINGETDLVWKSHREKDYTHPYSAANYLVWMTVGDDLLIVSAIPPHSLTSHSHSHPIGVVETYGWLDGVFDLHTNELDMVIRMAEGSREQHIMPGVRHTVETHDSWALIPIVITRGALFRPDDLHKRWKT